VPVKPVTTNTIMAISTFNDIVPFDGEIDAKVMFSLSVNSSVMIKELIASRNNI
jgi:hypothetical protein